MLVCMYMCVYIIGVPNSGVQKKKKAKKVCSNLKLLGSA